MDTPECVGIGLALGKSLTAQLFRSDTSLRQAALTALYILNEVKKWVDGCGGNSDIIILSRENLKWARFPTDEVSGLEKHFDQFIDYVRPILVAVADSTVKEGEFDILLKNFVQRDMLGLRSKFMSTKEFFKRVSDASGIQLDVSDLDDEVR